VCSCVSLYVPEQEQGTYAVMHKYYHNNFSVSKTILHKSMNKEGLLYLVTYIYGSI
jgi:hypothetical protein